MPTDRRGDSFPPIRQLGPDDVKKCVALSVDRGWLPERAKWSLFLAASEVFGVDAPDGRGLAGAVVLTRWGADYASAGMMLVAARYGRRGLGRALMEHLLRAAGDDATVTLFATDMGRPLYEKLGFEAVRRNVSFRGQFRASSASDNSKKRGARASGAGSARAASPAGMPGGVRVATEADLPAILSLDRAAFGADRGAILTRLPAFADRIAVLDAGGQGGQAGQAGQGGQGGQAGQGGQGGQAGQAGQAAALGIVGYAAMWRNEPASAVIGPLVAPDGEAASRLITELAARTPTPIRLDLDPDRPELPGWAHAHGLEPISRTVVMAHGNLGTRGTPGRLFAPISVALA